MHESMDITTARTTAEDLRRLIKDKVMKYLSQLIFSLHQTGITVSIGAAPNKLLAKLASVQA